MGKKFLYVMYIITLSIFMIACSSDFKSLKQNPNEVFTLQKEISQLNNKIANLEKEILAKNIEILDQQTKLEKSDAIILNLESSLDSIRNELPRVITPREYNTSLLESLQWIQEIAFNNRKYPEIEEKNEEDSKILSEIINSEVIKVDENKVILTYSLSKPEDDSYYKVDCLYYDLVDLQNESGGLIGALTFHIIQKDNSFELKK